MSGMETKVGLREGHWVLSWEKPRKGGGRKLTAFVLQRAEKAWAMGEGCYSSGTAKWQNA